MSVEREQRYQPFYCEENVWWLIQRPELRGFERHAVFISNELRQCPLWQQRASSDGLVVWDYHVIAIVRRDDVEAWDLDSRLAMPARLDHYLDRTFPPQAPQAPPFAPRFRLVSARELLARFRTDRGHMRGEDGWLQPPPDWPCPTPSGSADDGGPPSNLARFIDMKDDIAGEIMDLAALRRRFADPSR